jgi:copper chaperone CopZ
VKASPTLGSAGRIAQWSEPGERNTPVRLGVPTIACGGCAALLTDRIGQVAGVEDVQVDIAGKTVTVIGVADKAAVCAAISEAGHQAGWDLFAFWQVQFKEEQTGLVRLLQHFERRGRQRP